MQVELALADPLAALSGAAAAARVAVLRLWAGSNSLAGCSVGLSASSLVRSFAGSLSLSLALSLARSLLIGELANQNLSEGKARRDKLKRKPVSSTRSCALVACAAETQNRKF